MTPQTFKKGIHPPDGKEIAMDKAIEVIMPDEGALMVYPVSQHIGAPCEPIVAKGDRVLAGQRIAESSAPFSAPIHASVSGTVKDIKDMLTVSGAKCKSIIIENDGKMELDPSLGKDTDWEKFDRDKLIEKVKNAGIVGLGGAGFPTHIKLNTPPDKNIDSIIVNAAECEPYLTTDYRVMLEDAESLVQGLKIMLKIHPKAKGYIAIEVNKPKAIEKMEELTKNDDNITVVPLVTKYPQGSEKHLIYSVTKREVPSGKLPADVGCIVDNVDTVVAIQRAVMEDIPLMRRIVTVSGDGAVKPGNYEVRIGMNFKDFFDKVGGFTDETVKVIAGGPMMGPALYTLDVPMVKTSSAIVCFSEKQAYIPEASPCIRCGKCVEACPMGLMPTLLAQAAQKHDYDAFEKNDGVDCVECGSCSYVCPAKRHLTQTLRVAKRETMAIIRGRNKK